MKIEYILRNKEITLTDKIFNTIKEEEIKGINIYKINSNSKKIKRTAKRLSKKLYKRETKNVVLSKELYDMEKLKNILYSNNINILDGRLLFKYMIYDTIKYIRYKQNKSIEDCKISILTNENKYINVETIILISRKVRELNIVTNEIESFKTLENNLYNNFGISLIVTNNKKRAIAKSDIIINIDFPAELINKYNIGEKSIIVNIKQSVIIKAKRFKGININGFDIELPNKFVLKDFYNKHVYESQIINKNSFEEVRNKIKKDNIKIDYLIGMNGIINDKEFVEIL